MLTALVALLVWIAVTSALFALAPIIDPGLQPTLEAPAAERARFRRMKEIADVQLGAAISAGAAAAALYTILTLT